MLSLTGSHKPQHDPAEVLVLDWGFVKCLLNLESICLSLLGIPPMNANMGYR
jgi:hypothetical protein